MNRLSFVRRFAPLLFAVTAVLAPTQAFALPSIFTGSESDFYELPPGTPVGAPGTVVRWQRYTPSAGLTFNSDGVIAYRMLYVSTGAAGQKTLVSGSVLVPVRVAIGARPIIGFGSGTQGMADACAASHGIQSSTNYDIVYMRQALDKGWALAVSDYQGLGTKTDLIGGAADDHTYVVGQVLGRNVLDATRAASQFNAQFDADRAAQYPLKFIISGNLSLTSSKVALLGYSEGANSASWAAELSPTYAPELKVVGLAAGGIPADLYTAGLAINKLSNIQNVSFGALLAAGIGYKQAYPELHFDDKLNDAGVAKVAEVKQQCIIDIVIHNFGGHVITDYTNGGYSMLTDPAWLARFEQNKLGKSPPKFPVYLYHGVVDEVLTYDQARDLARAYCAAKTAVSWNPYVGDHLTVFLQGMGGALDFLTNVINGTATSSTPCSSIN